ncbi:DPP IV N-terminal domain-containing protein [Calditrichota bacterium]
MRIILILTCFLFFAVISCKSTSEAEPKAAESSYKVVFVSDRDGNNQIFIMDMDGSNEARLTQDSENYYFPQFSPNGSKILFYSHENGNDEIYIMDADGSNQINLTITPGNDNLCQFSPDGSKIVFTSDRDGNREIYTMNIDGSNQTRLTFNNYTDHSPQFSPDGSTIVFYSVKLIDDNILPHADLYDIYSIDTNGDNLTKLTADSTHLILTNFIPDFDYGTYDASPRFSPDGSKITFMSYFRNHGFDVFIIDRDGNNKHRLTNIVGTNAGPVFNPDGSKILFRTHRYANFDIFSMNLDGTDQTNLTPNTNHAYFCQFSPDGTKILFNDNNDIDDSGFKYKIYIMDADGNNRKMLSQSSFYYHDMYPSFQPLPSNN